MPEDDVHRAASMSGDAVVFSSYLREQGQDWLLLDQRDDQHARLRFTGSFQERMVVWDCVLVTLSAGKVERNFIDIQPPEASGVPLRVGLSIERIDIPAIEKMIIMIRHYKRLRVGRHEYGETRSQVSREQ